MLKELISEVRVKKDYEYWQGEANKMLSAIQEITGGDFIPLKNVSTRAPKGIKDWPSKLRNAILKLGASGFFKIIKDNGKTFIEVRFNGNKYSIIAPTDINDKLTFHPL